MILGNSRITIVRRAPGAFTEQGYAPGAETLTSRRRASVQPLDGEALTSLPEGLRASARYKMYISARADIRAQSIPSTGALVRGALPDMIIYRGVRYRVYRDSSYHTSGLLRSARYFLALPESEEAHPDGI